MSKPVKLVSIRWSLIRNIGLLILALSSSILAVSMLRSRSMVKTLCHDLFHRTASQTDREFHRFFDPVTSSLGIVGRWTEAGTLQFNDVNGANALIEPLLEYTPQVLALTTGDAQGSSYHFLNVENGWQNRLVTVDGEGNRRVEKWLWDGAGELSRRWREDDDAFNPTTRPWYRDVVGQLDGGGKMGALTWTPPYVFYSTRQPGITVARMAAQPDGGRSVVSLDVHLTEMTRYIRSLSISPNGYAFIVTEDGKLVRLPQHGGDEDEVDLAKTFARDPASQGMDATASLLTHAGGVSLRPLDSVRYKLGGEWFWGASGRSRSLEFPAFTLEWSSQSLIS